MTFRLKTARQACAWSESINWQEIAFLLRYLVEKGWVQAGTFENNRFKGWVTVEGYSRVEEVQVNVDSSQVFVAMWFHEEMDDAYNKGIEPADSQHWIHSSQDK